MALSSGGPIKSKPARYEYCSVCRARPVPALLVALPPGATAGRNRKGRADAVPPQDLRVHSFSPASSVPPATSGSARKISTSFPFPDPAASLPGTKVVASLFEQGAGTKIARRLARSSRCGSIAIADSRAPIQQKMSMPRAIDHLVLASHDLERQADRFRRLGFTVGERNAHPWGHTQPDHPIRRPLLSGVDRRAGFFADGAGRREQTGGRSGLRRLSGGVSAPSPRGGHGGFDQRRCNGRCANFHQGGFRRRRIARIFAQVDAAGRAGSGSCVLAGFRQGQRGRKTRPVRLPAPTENFWSPAQQIHANGVLWPERSGRDGGKTADFAEFLSAVTGQREMRRLLRPRNGFGQRFGFAASARNPHADGFRLPLRLLRPIRWTRAGPRFP